MRADADGPSWRTRQKRRERDIEFLAWLRTATKRELAVMMNAKLPDWRAVAVRRALKRALLK
jgi:hypothetical protein